MLAEPKLSRDADQVAHHPPEVRIIIGFRLESGNNRTVTMSRNNFVSEMGMTPFVNRLQFNSPTCGAAAAVLLSQWYAKQSGLDARIPVRDQAMTTDFTSILSERDPVMAVGYDLTRAAADLAYRESGIGPDESHDCFTTNEILRYEALRLTPEGAAARFVNVGDNAYGGRIVTNPSGGLLSNGRPRGATVPPNVPNPCGSDVLPQRIYARKTVISLGCAGVPEEDGAVSLFCTPESDYITGQLIAGSGGLVF